MPTSVQPRPLLPGVWLCGSLLAALAAPACSSAPQPAPSYRLSGPEQSSCPRSVQILTFAQVPGSYREVSRLSVTCPYLLPNGCERRLLARGCELGADAIVLTRSKLQGSPGKNKVDLADEAVAIRFQSPPH